MDPVKKILYLSTNIQTGCRECRAILPHDDGYFQAAVNHMLAEHGFKLLHVGQQTEPDGADGRPYQTTVAVLGVG